jgi:DNA topoisomerase III
MEAVVNEKGKAYILKWGRGKIFERNIVTILHSRIFSITQAEVIEVEKSQVHKSKPQGLNTVKMLKVASKTYGMSAHETMKIAEHLYLRGFVTYPRTESTTYSANFNFNEILAQHAYHPDWGYYAA